MTPRCRFCAQTRGQCKCGDEEGFKPYVAAPPPRPQDEARKREELQGRLEELLVVLKRSANEVHRHLQPRLFQEREQRVKDVEAALVTMKEVESLRERNRKLEGETKRIKLLGVEAAPGSLNVTEARSLLKTLRMIYDLSLREDRDYDESLYDRLCVRWARHRLLKVVRDKLGRDTEEELAEAHPPEFIYQEDTNVKETVRFR